MRHPLKPSGTLIITDPSGGGEIHKPTVQCVHCGRHWVFVPGSGRKRGWCGNCGGITCGSEACDVCVPLEQLLENIEQDRDPTYRPVIIGVPAEPPGK